jgi:predicted 3-demethylubiquinone-9 3-methyltransferase (glyoxalase superfamily)
MTTSITTFLTYDAQAEEAAKLYASLLDGHIKDTMRYPAGGPRPEGAVLSVKFELFGQTYVALNGGPTFPFGQGFSLLPPPRSRPRPVVRRRARCAQERVPLHVQVMR